MVQYKTNFKLKRVFEPVFTGGCAKLSPDGQYLFSCIGNDINVLNVGTGITERVLRGSSDEVTCFAVKPSGTHLVSASRALLLTCFDVNTGQAVRSWKAHEAPVLAMAFDSTSTLVATGSADSTVKVWDCDRGHATHNFRGHSGIVSAVTFLTKPETGVRTGKKGTNKSHIWLASGSEDCKIKIWDLTTKSLLASLDSHVSVIRGLAFSRDGGYLVSGGRDQVLNIWDVHTFNLIRTVLANESIESVGLLNADAAEALLGRGHTSSSHLLAYTGGEKGLIRVWDLTDGMVIASQRAELNSKHEINDVLYLEPKNQLVAVTSDQNLLFYDISNSLQRCHQIIGSNDEVIDIAFVAEDESLLAVATNSEQIRLYDLESSDSDILYGHNDTVICLDRSADGLLIASGSKDNNAVIWSKSDATKWFDAVAVCVGHTASIGAIAISRKSSAFVITGSEDRTVKCWDISALQRTSSESLTKVKALYTFQAHEKDINSVAIAPNDKLFATGSQDKTAKIWSCSDGTLLGVCRGHKRGVWSVSFSPLDQVLATSSGDKTIKLWSASDFSCLKTFEGHLNSVLKVSFISLGTQLVSCGSDGLVKLWTVRSGDCVGTYDNHDDKVWSLAVKRDESLIASGSADSKICLWEDCTATDEQQRSQEQALRIEKEQELSNCLYKKNFRSAVLLAMDLKLPFKLLGVFKEMKRQLHDADSVTGSKDVDTLITSFDDNQIETLLFFIRDWNTNTRHSRVAQSTLNLILRSFSVERLLKVPKIKEILDGLIPYTERHYSHAEELLKQNFSLQFTLDCMEDL